LQRSYHKGKPQLTGFPLSHPSQNDPSRESLWDAFQKFVD